MIYHITGKTLSSIQKRGKVYLVLPSYVCHPMALCFWRADDENYTDTQNGFVCLEALVSDVSVPVMGRSFDGRSGYDFRVQPSIAGALQRSTLQLRPREPFYVRDLAFTLVPESSHEHVVRLASLGNVPTYEAYSQHVSQVGESQNFLTPSPQKSSRAMSVLETPTKSKGITPITTPLVQKLATSAIEGKESSQTRPRDPEERAVLQALRELDKHDDPGNQVSPQIDETSFMSLGVRVASTTNCLEQMQMKPQILDLKERSTECRLSEAGSEVHEGHLLKSPKDVAVDGFQDKTKSDHIRSTVSPFSNTEQIIETGHTGDLLIPSTPLKSPKLQFEKTSRAEMSNIDNEHRRKRRRLSSGPAYEATEESQDSLAGKTITVAERKDNSTKKDIANTDVEEHGLTSSLSMTADPRTPSIVSSFQGSPYDSLRPASSTRSTRSTFREHPGCASTEESTRIVFASSTSVGDSKAFKKFLAGQGVEIVQDLKSASCLCVGKGELKRTSKLISAVLLGLDIVTDDWVTDSVRLKKLQNVVSYFPRDPQRESEWDMKLDEAIERGRQGFQMLKDLNVVFTAKAKKDLGKTGFDDLKEIAIHAGAKSVGTSMLQKSSDGDAMTIIIASSEDLDTPILRDKRFFTRDIIGLSILRGRLDLEGEEFVVKKGQSQSTGNKKRKR